MKAESETFIPERSILKGMNKSDIENKYNIKVLPNASYMNSPDNIHVFGDWDNIARFEKDLFTLK